MWLSLSSTHDPVLLIHHQHSVSALSHDALGPIQALLDRYQAARHNVLVLGAIQQAESKSKSNTHRSNRSGKGVCCVSRRRSQLDPSNSLTLVVALSTWAELGASPMSSLCFRAVAHAQITPMPQVAAAHPMQLAAAHLTPQAATRLQPRAPPHIALLHTMHLLAKQVTLMTLMVMVMTVHGAPSYSVLIPATPALVVEGCKQMHLVVALRVPSTASRAGSAARGWAALLRMHSAHSPQVRCWCCQGCDVCVVCACA